ncbi:MAG: hypothetical protein COT81_05665, partial [Candidatus Buchananbacteria bacterium CG10_big_fil_rev_8_21_14_0_10_42_9]
DNYNFNASDIEVVSSNAQLIGSPGGGGSGATTDPSFDVPDWAPVNWDVNGPESAPTISLQTPGNPGNFGEISIPTNSKRRSLGGLWQQAFTTTVANPDTATCSFDWQVTAADPNVQVSRLEVFLDNFSGEPSPGATGVWSQNFTTTSGWQTVSFDCSNSLTTAGTYYFKLGVWLENSNNAGNTPITVGFDNAQVQWGKAGTIVYPTTNPGVNPFNSYTGTIENWFSFTETASKPVGTEIYYQLSDDDGTSWQWWDGGAWALATIDNVSTANVATEVDANIATFPIVSGRIMFRAYLASDGSAQPQLDRVTISSGAVVGSSGYTLLGILESSAFDTGGQSAFNTIQWTETLPSANENIQVQISTAPDDSGSPGTWSAWTGLSGSGTYFVDPNETVIPLTSGHNDDQWIRYRVELLGDGTDTPVLQDITLNYTP